MIQLMGVDEFLAMLNNGAGRKAMAERDATRSWIYDASLQQALANGVDEMFAPLYAQCAMHDYDRRNTQ